MSRTIRTLFVSYFRPNTLGIDGGFEAVGEVVRFNWEARLKAVGRQAMNAELREVALGCKPDLVFIEETWTGDVRPTTIQDIKNQIDVVAIDWNGDYYSGGLLESTLEIGQVVDWVLLSNRNQAQQYRERGISTGYLPAGCAPDTYQPVIADRETYPADIVFLGSPDDAWPNGRLRRRMCRKVYQVYGERFRVYGRGWQRDLPFVYPYLEPAPREAEVYSSCKIALGINAVTSPGYTSARMWKAMASGAFYLCHYFPGIEDWFENRRHLVWWRGLNELMSKIRYYLAHDGEREAIAQAGCAEVRQNHSWQARAEEVLRRFL